jgi:hypothetical protein
MRSSGDIVYCFNYMEEQATDPEKRLADFIRLSIDLSDCLENGTTEEYETRAVEEEEFMDLIDCKDWSIVKDGEKTPVLCPIFYENDEITWQIDAEEPKIPTNG